MNRFDQLCALGMARSTAIVGQPITVGAVADVQAVVSPIRREERFKENGNQFWVDAGDIVIARANWPENQPLPNSGAIIVLADGRRFRLGPMTSTDALLKLTFTSLY